MAVQISFFILGTMKSADAGLSNELCFLLFKGRRAAPALRQTGYGNSAVPDFRDELTYSCKQPVRIAMSSDFSAELSLGKICQFFVSLRITMFDDSIADALHEPSWG